MPFKSASTYIYIAFLLRVYFISFIAIRYSDIQIFKLLFISYHFNWRIFIFICFKLQSKNLLKIPTLNLFFSIFDKLQIYKIYIFISL